VTVECIIPQKYHRTVMGAKGHQVQEITREFEVNIKFPDRPTENKEGTHTRSRLVRAEWIVFVFLLQFLRCFVSYLSVYS